jgi:hypothetical protein
MPPVQIQFAIQLRCPRQRLVKIRVRAIQIDGLVLDLRIEQVSLELGRPSPTLTARMPPSFYVAELLVDLTEQIHETDETDDTTLFRFARASATG